MIGKATGRKGRAAVGPRTGAETISEALRIAGARPTVSDTQTAKNKYASRFADAMAVLMAEDLAPRFKGIKATTKRDAPAAGGKKKQLDINFSTPDLGLALGVSLKSVHLRDVGSASRYTHNMKRNEEELRVEANKYHKRQRYAVMAAVLFLPFDSVNDGKGNNPSSFGSWVRHLRPVAGRIEPDDEADRFEKVYIGLYDPAGADLSFFDVDADPPKNAMPATTGALRGADGRPRRLLTYHEWLDEIHHAYLRRNSAEFKWADGEEEPLDPEDPDDGDESESES